MSNGQFIPYDSEESGDTTLLARFKDGIRRDGPSLARGAVGGAAMVTVVTLAAAGLAPLLVGPAASGTIAWLQALGVNALAGWLGNWSVQESGRLISDVRNGDLEGQEQVIDAQALAAALQEQIEADDAIRDEVAQLLASTQALRIALDELPTRDEQREMLQALQADLQRNQVAQGQMHELLVQTISHLEEHLSAQLDALQTGVEALQPAQRLVVTQEEFFGPLLRPGRLFHHRWTLVGRDAQLDTLIKFALSPKYRAAILPGAGGIGKSRLLLEFAQRSTAVLPTSESIVRFVSEGVPITPAALNEVPAGPVLLIIDDGHRREDLLPLFHLAARRTQPLKLLIACRPQATGQLRSELQRAAFDATEIVELPRLEQMPWGDMEELARQVLGPEFARHADALAAATRDCPLVTVVGGRLLAEQAIPPSLLANNDSFRYAVLDRFREELIGRVSEQLQPDLCRRILKLLSILGPVRVNNEAQLDTMAGELGLSRPELVQDMGVLEDAGVLLRRGYTLRLVPDVLSDYVLHEACFTRQGALTGYADEVYETYRATHAVNILRNLAELDWRVRGIGEHEPDVLAEVWRSIEHDFSQADDGKRYQILSTLEDVAFYQPGRVMSLVEQAIRPNTIPPPSTEQQSPIERLLFGSPTHDNILHLLPKLLRRIGYHEGYLPRCCDLLWQLGRDDDRALNPTPEHAIRVLQDLAGYDLNKPVSVNLAVVEAVGRWLQEPDVHVHLYSPLDVLDPVFEKSAHTDYARGHVIQWSPFLVNKENTQALRDRAFEVVTSCTDSPNLKIVLRAIESLRKATAPVAEYVGLTITEDTQATWLPEQVRALDLLARLVRDDAHPLVLIKVTQAVGFYARYRRLPGLSKRAREILAHVPDSFEVRLTKAMAFSPTEAWILDQEEPKSAGEHRQRFERQQQVAATLRGKVAKEFMERYPDAEHAIEVLGNRLIELKEYDFNPYPNMFLFELVATNLDYGVRLCEALLRAPTGPLAPYLAIFLSAIRSLDVERAIALAQDVEATGNGTLCFSLANSQTWRDWAEPPLPADLEVLGKLANHRHAAVRLSTLQTLATLGWSQPNASREVIALALSVEIGDDPTLADGLCAVFDPQLGVPPDKLTDEEITTILSRLLPVKSIGGEMNGTGQGIAAFLSYAAGRVPVPVIELFMNRLDYAENVAEPGYKPVPYHFYGLDLAGLMTSEHYEDILRRVRDHALQGPNASRFWLQQLFPVVSLRFSAQSLSVLNEWICSGDPALIQATSNFLAQAPADFVFEQEAFTVQLLERAHAAGTECYRVVEANLHGSTISRAMNRTVGGPSSQLLQVQDRAQSAVSRATPGSPAYRFYNTISEWAERQIVDDALSDQEIMDC